MTLSREQKSHIDSIMTEAVYKAFDKIEDYREKEGLKPTEVMRDLDLGWDLGDFWAEWWQEGDDEEEWE
jgi:hypothetical protein